MDPNSFPGTFTTEHERSGSSRGSTSTTVPRKRNVTNEFQHPGIYEELEKLRNLVDEVEGDRVGCSGSARGTIDGSLMSTVFGVVLVMILSMSVYAFVNLYKAVYKRFYKDE